MKSSSVCLILGAGASMPYGYPLGSAFGNEIIAVGKQRQDWYGPTPAKCDEVWQITRKVVTDFESFRRQGGKSTTIDAFLDQERFRNRPDPSPEREEYEAALMLIAAVIRKCEQADLRTSSDWCVLLYDCLESSLAAGENWPITIIPFNYDRSFEFRTAKNRSIKTNCSMFEARHWLRNTLPILHVYGDVGPLPGWDAKSDDFAPEYGSFRGHDAWRGRERLMTIRRSETDFARYARCKEWVSNAEYVIALGFGFDETNCERLGFGNLNADKHLFATSFGDRVCHDRINKQWRGRKLIGELDEDCLKFLLRTRVLDFAREGKPPSDCMRQLS
jgi:hypothetical protein